MTAPLHLRELVAALSSESVWITEKLSDSVWQYRTDSLIVTLVLDDSGQLWTVEVPQ